MNKKVIPIVVRLKQNNNEIVQGINQDDAGVIFDITVMDGLKVFDFSGYTIVTLKITKPDGTITVDSTGGSYVDIVDAVHGRLKINIPTSCTAQNGMHYCRVGFSSDENTLFDAMFFNYFVGEDPNRETGDVIGTSEYPILQNLIAQVSGTLSAEQIRTISEGDRIDAEESRQSTTATLIALFVEALGFLEDRITELNSMLDELNEAIAHGGSVDISQISALATKSYVADYVKELNFGYNSQTGEKDSHLRIFVESSENMPDLEQGELAYAYDTHKLYLGEAHPLPNLRINQPAFIVSAETPAGNREKLWIDTSGSAPVIKYHDGTSWVSCNTAVYA